MSVIQQYNVQPWLTPVRVCDTANLAGTYYNGQLNNGVGATLVLSVGVLTIDSVNVKLADRVLLQAQTTSAQNGVYICVVEGTANSAAVLQRAADLQSFDQLSPGFYVSVAAGTAQAGSVYVLVEPKPSVVGIDAITFTSVAGSGSGVTATLPTTIGNIATYSNVNGDITQNSATAVNIGNIQAGGNGASQAGAFVSYPSPAASGNFVFQASAIAGNFVATVQNVNIGQSTVYHVPDPANANAQFMVGATTTPFVSGNLPVASGTAGLFADSGVSFGTLAATSGAYVSPPVTVAVTLTAAQVDAAFATPFQILANPPSGFAYYVMSATFTVLSTGHTAFAGGGVGILQYGVAGGGAGINALAATVPAAFIQSAANSTYRLGGIAAGAITGLAASGIWFSNQTGAFTAGTGSTLVITFTYYMAASA